MKRSHKITLAVLIPVLAGTLTIVEKSISIYNQIKPVASQVPENYKPTKKSKAGFIETENVKQIAGETK